MEVLDTNLFASSEKLDRAASEWTADSLHRTFLRSGCAVIRGAISKTLLLSVQNTITAAYAKTTDLHVYDKDLLEISGGRVSGYELVDLPLLNDFLNRLYAGQNWKKLYVAARRIQGVENNQDWQRPLDLHLDSQFHQPQFTTNFWIPFQDCGKDAPSLQLLPLDYLRTRQYSGYTGSPVREGEGWNTGYFPDGIFEISKILKTFGDECLFRPVMGPGDVIVASNWIVHGSYRTEQMTKGRTSVEIRFIGDQVDVRPAPNE